jgi:tRNA-dihydrouridine synthase B
LCSPGSAVKVRLYALLRGVPGFQGPLRSGRGACGGRRTMIQLGPLQLEHPFLLAPMAGITGSPFRRLMRRHGSALVVSELVSANGIRHGGRKTLELLQFHPEERPVGIQLFGEEPALLCEAARAVERQGADFVDLNLGCPVPKVVRKGGGAAMCRDLPALGRTLSAVVGAVRIPVTIKIRSGWDEDSRNAHEVVRVAADAGVRWVAIHGRTRAQGYAGRADWELMAEVKARSPIPIVGNGDLFTPEQAVAALWGSGVDAVMIGRGALRNAFFFDQARELWSGRSWAPPESSHILSFLGELKTLLEERHGTHGGVLLRKFLAWYSSGYPGCHEFRRKVFSSVAPGELWDEAVRFFTRDPAKRDLSCLEQPFLKGGHG